MSLKSDCAIVKKTDKGIKFVTQMKYGEFTLCVDIGPNDYKSWEQFVSDIKASKHARFIRGKHAITHHYTPDKDSIIRFETGKPNIGCEFQIPGAICLGEFEKLLHEINLRDM